MVRRGVIVLLVLVAAGIGFMAWRPLPSPGPIAKKTQQASSLAHLRAQAPAPRKAPAPTSERGPVPACDEPWGRILETGFRDWLEAIRASGAGRSAQCEAWEKNHWPQHFGPYPASICFAPDTIDAYLRQEPGHPQPAQVTQCLSTLTFYRSWAVLQATRGHELDGMSATLLANKIVARFFEMGTDPSAKNDIKSWNERLKHLEPDLYPAHKIDLILEFVDGEPDFTRVSRQIEQLQRYGVADPEVQSVELVELSKRGVDPELLQERLEEFASQSPQDPRWDYFRGYLKWKAGDKEGATAFVRRAAQRDPANTNYAKTLELIPSHPAGAKDIFFVNVGFQLDNL